VVRARRFSNLVCWSVLVLGVWSPTRFARADGVSFGPHDVHSVFHVEKSENQNQVHYGVRVDAACRPADKDPVFAYWRRLKKGARVDEPLVGAGIKVYGTSTGQKVQAGEHGGQVEMFVRALKKLPIQVLIEKTASGCKAVAYATVSGDRARLSHAFVQLRSLGLGVRHVDVFGLRERDGARVTQQFR